MCCEHVAVNHVAPVAEMGDLLVRCVAEPAGQVELPSDSGPYRCLAGHGWTPEHALWFAVRTLEEKTALARRMAVASRSAGRDLVAQRYDNQEEEELAAAAASASIC